MKQQFSTPEGQAETDSRAEPLEKNDRKLADENRRNDPRCALKIQAFVAIPSLQSRAYGICEISRGGMFLAFKDARSTKLELEQNDIGAGTHVEVAFSVSLPDGKYRFRVRARIARITAYGIGVQFITHNPPQLAALREVFSQGGADLEDEGPQIRASDAAEAKRLLANPTASTAWQNWELVD
jgi:hypothetical protein